MTSNIDIERDAALGRIFREMLEALAKIERAYLDKNPRTAKDFREAAGACLIIIGDRLKGARAVEPNALQGYTLPEPLHRLLYELTSVANRMPSVLLSPDNSRKPKGRASSNLWGVHVQSAAIRVHDAMIEFVRPADQAAKEVASCFQASSVKMNGKPVTAATVKEWSDERGRKKTKLPRLVTEQLAELDRLIDELRRVEFYERPIASFYRKTYMSPADIGYLCAVHHYDDNDRAEMLLDWLRNFIRTTACD